MYVFVVTLHIILCLILVLVILMQPGKGGDISSAFGGGSSSQLFGAAGPGNFLTRGTGIVAGLFMVTSITLALYSTEAARGGGGVKDELEDVLQEGEEGSGFGVGGGTSAPAPTAPAPAAPSPAAPAPAAPGAAPADGSTAPDAAPADGSAAPAAPAAPGATPPVEAPAPRTAPSP